MGPILSQCPVQCLSAHLLKLDVSGRLGTQRQDSVLGHLFISAMHGNGYFHFWHSLCRHGLPDSSGLRGINSSLALLWGGSWMSRRKTNTRSRSGIRGSGLSFQLRDATRPSGAGALCCAQPCSWPPRRSSCRAPGAHGAASAASPPTPWAATAAPACAAHTPTLWRRPRA